MLKLLKFSDKVPRRPINTLKIYNTHYGYLQNWAFSKNFSLLAVSETPLEFDNSTATFEFVDMDGSVYQISGFDHKMVKIGTGSNDLRIAPKTSRKSLEKDLTNYDISASGVRIGDFFWILGGRLGDDKISWGKHMENRKSALFHIKKLSWLRGKDYLTLSGEFLASFLISNFKFTGPELPHQVFSFHSSAIALNSSHVAIIGGNIETNTESADAFWIIWGLERTSLTIVYDFIREKWSFWARLPLKKYHVCFLRHPISTAIHIDKTYNRFENKICNLKFNGFLTFLVS